MSAPAAHPWSLRDMIDYALGELDRANELPFEEHMFSCEMCAREVESVFRLGAALFRAVAGGHAAAPVSDALLKHAQARGARVREYRLTPGEIVPCTAAPDDTFVAVRLVGPPAGVRELSIDVAFENLETGERWTRRTEGVPVDVLAREVVLLFPGGTVRQYPRSRWTMYADAGSHVGQDRLGPYTLDHTPWDQQQGDEPR